MFSRRETEVMVVGAGPVGLFAALALVERGIQIQVLDKGWRGSVHSYALALHGESLRMLDELGIAQDLVEAGHKIRTVAIYNGQERVAELSLADAGGSFPYVLVLPQSELESTLEGRLRDKKVKVEWNHQLMAVETVKDKVDAEVAKMDKVSLGYPVARTEWVIDKTFHSRASFLIGADGYYSFVRRAIGAKSEPAGEKETYAVFEFHSPIDLGDEARLVLHDDGVDVLWPMTGGRGRWSFQVKEAPQPVADVAHLAEFLRRRAPWFSPAPDEIFWGTAVRFERYLVDGYGADRVWLAGDSAHATGPLGVQSMNVGFREARALADRFDEILRGSGSFDGLQAYGQGFRAEWQRMLGISGEPKVLPGAPDWAGAAGARLRSALPASGEALAALLRQVGLEFA
jgi:2-polyprenyl-6-methoxyphenol hydroxylase-like FAD-dependent oxidoreductase